MAITTKELYPHSIHEVARRLGVSTASVYNKIKKVSDINWTHLGSGRYFNNEAIAELEKAGVGRRSWNPNNVLRKSYNTPLGTVIIDADIPIPSREGVESYPFDEMEVGHSFAVPANSKSTMEKQVTAANKSLAPKKYARRLIGEQVRVWRTE